MIKEYVVSNDGGSLFGHPALAAGPLRVMAKHSDVLEIDDSFSYYKISKWRKELESTLENCHDELTGDERRAIRCVIHKFRLKQRELLQKRTKKAPKKAPK